MKIIYLINVFLRANQSQRVKIFDFQGKELSCIKHHEGFLGKRIAAVTCLDWNLFKVKQNLLNNYLKQF